MPIAGSLSLPSLQITWNSSPGDPSSASHRLQDMGWLSALPGQIKREARLDRRTVSHVGVDPGPAPHPAKHGRTGEKKLQCRGIHFDNKIPLSTTRVTQQHLKSSCRKSRLPSTSYTPHTLLWLFSQSDLIAVRSAHMQNDLGSRFLRTETGSHRPDLATAFNPETIYRAPCLKGRDASAGDKLRLDVVNTRRKSSSKRGRLSEELNGGACARCLGPLALTRLRIGGATRSPKCCCCCSPPRPQLVRAGIRPTVGGRQTWGAAPLCIRALDFFATGRCSGVARAG
jgi:hypothetical protein